MKALLTVGFIAVFAAASSARAEDSAEIYKSKCKSCHGDDGAGKTKIGIKEKVEDMSDAKWQAEHTDAQILEVIAEGSKDNKKMKAFKEKLSAEEMKGLVAYIRTLKK